MKGFKGEKAVFVASDDPNAIQESRDKYKDFIFKDKSFYFNKSEIDDTKYIIYCMRFLTYISYREVISWFVL
jgi:hypothetical protein